MVTTHTNEPLEPRASAPATGPGSPRRRWSPGGIFAAMVGLALMLVLGVNLWLKSATTTATVLVYEVAPSEANISANATAEDAVPALYQRLSYGPWGRPRVRAVDDSQLEITLLTTDLAALAHAKSLVASSGVLRFAILANPIDHGELIELARQQAEHAATPPAMTVDGDADRKGRWARVAVKNAASGVPGRPSISLAGTLMRDAQSGAILDITSQPAGADPEREIAIWLSEHGIRNVDVLTVIEPDMDVGGDDLALASRSRDADDSPAISFKLNEAASSRFHRLTLTYQPDGDFRRRLGIILDDVVLSAPSINSPIRGSGIISGDFSDQEVDRIMQVLQAGQLPLALQETPVSEKSVEIPLRWVDLLPSF